MSMLQGLEKVIQLGAAASGLLLVIYLFILGVFALDRRAWGEGGLFVLAAAGWWLGTVAASAPLWLGCLGGGCADKRPSLVELAFETAYCVLCVLVFLFVRKRYDKREWSQPQ